MRRFEFPVDGEYAREVNETVVDMRRLRLWSIVVACVLGVLTAGLIWLDHPSTYILASVFVIAIVIALWVAIWSPRRLGSIEKVYATGDLVPAMIAEVHTRSITILALVDVAKPAAKGTKYALVARSVRTLPGHKRWPGEKVPAVSVLSDRVPRPGADTWQVANPMPIAWGTADSEVIAQAVSAISDVEWNVLARNVSRSRRVRKATGQRLLLDAEEVPAELR